MNKIVSIPQDMIDAADNYKEAVKKAFLDACSELELYGKLSEVRFSVSCDTNIIVIYYNVNSSDFPADWEGKIRLQGDTDKRYLYSFQLSISNNKAYYTNIDIEFNDFDRLSTFLFDSRTKDVIAALGI